MTVTIEELYDTQAARIRGLALRMTGDADVADQLTQDILVRAWRALPTFRGESTVGSWVRAIGVHVIVDHIRAEQRRQGALEMASRSFAHPRANDGSAREDQRLDLERAITDLPAGARAILVLHDIEGFKHADIACQLNVSVGTVKSQLHRARRLLAEALK